MNKKIIMTFLVMFCAFFSMNSIKAEEWKCMECDGVYTWTNLYNETTSKCYQKKVVSSDKCKNGFGYNDTVKCSYTAVDIININDPDGDYTYDLYNFALYPVVIEHKMVNNKEVLTSKYYLAFDEEYRDVSIEISHFKDSGDQKFYCPKYIYGDTSDGQLGVAKINRLSASMKPYTFNDGSGTQISDYKIEYILDDNIQHEKKDYKCYKCNGGGGKWVYQWLSDQGSNCQLLGNIKTSSECTSPDEKCYDLCEQIATPDKNKYYCRQYYEHSTSLPSKTYSLKNEVDLYKCGINVDLNSLTSCGIYKFSSPTPDGDESIEVYKSSNGSYTKIGNNYIYIRDSKSNDCPSKVTKVLNNAVVIEDKTRAIYAGNDYYIVSDSSNLNQNTCLLTSECREYEKVLSKEEYTGKKDDSKSNNNNINPVSGEDKCVVLTPRIKEKINWVLDLIKYGGAVLVIVLGSADFLRATLSDEDNASKKAFEKFIKRLIAAVLLFLLPLLIQLLFTTINNPVIKIPGFNFDNPTCGIGVSE